jgi:sec-independent protein translocase protein TatB
MPDILFILVLALVIFGPKKLPELGRQLGKYHAQFRRMKREWTGLMETEMSKIREAEEVDQAVGKAVAPAAQTATNDNLAQGGASSKVLKPPVHRVPDNSAHQEHVGGGFESAAPAAGSLPSIVGQFHASVHSTERPSRS